MAICRIITVDVFYSGITQATSSVISQPNLVKKVVFSLALLPLVPVLSAFIESAFGLIALLGVLVKSDRDHF